MAKFVETAVVDTEEGVDKLIFELEKEQRWQKVREKIEKVNMTEVKEKEQISKLDLIKAFSSPEKPKGSIGVKKQYKECQRVFHLWYGNFLPKAGHSQRNLKSDKREVNAKIKSNPGEYAETTEGFKQRMRSIIANPSDPSLKNAAIKFLSKAYPK